MRKPFEVLPGDSAGGLHLERHGGAIVALSDEVDVVAVTGSPVSYWANVVEPGRLLAQLANDERLQQVTQLGQLIGPSAASFAGVGRSIRAATPE